jgi:RimJ/RimL family protein N-acetyltransferase
MSGPDARSVQRGIVLETPRLVMRPLGREHLPDLLSLYEDPEVVRFLAPLDEAGHLQRIEEAARMWATRGFGRVAVHERATGRFVGRGGLQYWARFDEVEVTWALRRDAWGRGLATEAGGAWLEWGLEHLDVPYVTALIAPENTGSRAVAERIGMSVLRTDVQHGREVLVYARDLTRRPDARPARHRVGRHHRLDGGAGLGST